MNMFDNGTSHTQKRKVYAWVKRASHINVPENFERRQRGGVVNHCTIIYMTTLGGRFQQISWN